MNNTRYLEWISDLLPLSFHETHYLSSCKVCYLQESLPEQTLRLSWHLGKNGLLSLDGYLPESTPEKRIFAAQIQFEDCVL